MKNNKGFTVIEFVVSFVLTSIIVLMLFQLIFALKDIYVGSGVKTQLLANQSIISEKINKELRTKTLTMAYRCGLNCISFHFSDGSSSVLDFSREKGTLSYGNYFTKLTDGSQFGNINITTDTVVNVAAGKNNSVVLISIPIFNKLLPKEEFGINIVYQYNNRDVAVSGLFVSDVLDVERRLYLIGSENDIAFSGIPYVDPGYFVLSANGTVVQNDTNNIVKTGTVGTEIGKTYTITYTVLNSNSKVIDVKTRNVTVVNSVYTYAYSGSGQLFTVPINGLYEIEVWGAQGGSRGTYDVGGKGGYTVGRANLAKNNTLHVYVGGSGSYNSINSVAGGFNGGGASGAGSTSAGGSGGGASDVRSNGISLANRIIVAGGGGGSGSKNDSAALGNGGFGGGASGQAGTCSTTSYNGAGGTSSTGGAKATFEDTVTVLPTVGSLGLGGIGGSYSDTFGGGGGGGGYYGGGGGVRYGAGGGGSGYCGSMLNCTMKDGSATFNSPVGVSGVGNSGSGYVKITLISITG